MTEQEMEMGADAKHKEKQELTTWTDADGGRCSYGPVTKRVCTKCRESFDWDGTEYKRVCRDCFKKNVRTCVACKVNNLKIDAKAYEKVCTSCFLAKKALTYGTCPTCPPSRSKHLRRPLDKDVCNECALRLVRVGSDW